MLHFSTAILGSPLSPLCNVAKAIALSGVETQRLHLTPEGMGETPVGRKRNYLIYVPNNIIELKV
jgi:hypothetical protein